MKITDLEKRGEFGKPFCRDLSLYFSSSVKRDIRFCWGNESNYPYELYVNKRLNCVFYGGIEGSAFANVRREFSYDSFFLKRFFKTLYTFFGTTQITRRFLADYKIGVNDLDPQVKDCLILPGRNKIRLIHFSVGTCTVLMRSNTNKNRFLNEYKAQSLIHSSLVPTAMPGSIESNYFREQYIEGKPANRFHESVHKKLIAEASYSLYEKSIKPKSYRVDFETYLSKTLEEIRLLAPQTFQNCKNLAESEFSSFYADEIEISVSHGDFQEANILSTNSGFKIIDWEHLGERYFIYDMFTLLSGIRAKKDKARAILSFIGSRSANSAYIKCSSQGKRPMNLRLVAFIWLLEELHFLLCDNEDRMRDSKKEVDLMLLNEINTFSGEFIERLCCE